MKTCSKCKQEKELDQFNEHNSTKDKKSAWCSECILKRSKEYYKNNKDKQLIKYQKQRELTLLSLKEGKKCEKCGETNLIMLDFHHLDPKQKESDISNLIKKRKNIEEIKTEINKCIVLCSNHHREFHYLERKKSITIHEYLNAAAVI